MAPHLIDHKNTAAVGESEALQSTKATVPEFPPSRYAGTHVCAQ